MVVTKKKITKENPQQETCLVFCCGGGITTGAIKEEGYNVLGGVDTWGFAQEIYEKNYPDCKFLKKSLRELTPEMLCEEFGIVPGEIGMIQISNPCTGVSSLGEGEQLSAVNDLFFVATALAFALNSKVVLFENVKNLTRGDMNMLFGMFWAFLQRAGVNYNMDAMVLNSWLYGDPQSRERIFIMCVRKDVGHPVWPETVPLGQRTYIRDVLPEAEYVVNYSYGKRIYQPYQPAPTIVGGPCLTVYEGETERDLTPREYARFMGIPDWYILEGSVSNQKLLIGNGVTWGVTRSLAAVIRDRVLNTGPAKVSEPLALVDLVEVDVKID